MKLQQFLEHYGLAANPFADEDAQTDTVLWPHGAAFASGGTTAIHRVADLVGVRVRKDRVRSPGGRRPRRLADYNADHPEHQVFVAQCDDIVRSSTTFARADGRGRRTDRGVRPMAIRTTSTLSFLAGAVTQLVDRILDVKQSRHLEYWSRTPPIEVLDAAQARDVALLAAIYDQSKAESPFMRWQRLRKKLRFSTWRSKWDLAVGGTRHQQALALGGGGRRGGHSVRMLAVIVAGRACRCIMAAFRKSTQGSA